MWFSKKFLENVKTTKLPGGDNKDPEQKRVEEENCNRVKKSEESEWRRE